MARNERKDTAPEIDGLGADALERLEAQSDPLIDLVGFIERERPVGEAFGDPRFVRWLEREGAHVIGEEELFDDEEITGLARRVLADLAADTLGVRCIALPAPALPVRDAGSISTAIERFAPLRQAVMHDLGVAAGVGCELWDAECEAVIPLPDELPTGRYLALRVKGDSMTPLMHQDDVVLVELGDHVVRDRVVVARGPEEGYVVKRVGKIASDSIELLSLNSAFAPVRIPRAPGALLGTVVLRWCAHG